MMIHRIPGFFLSLMLVSMVKSQGVIRNITVSAGEDIFIEWSNTDPVHVNWAKDGLNVAGTTAASEERVFTLPEQGLLILNSEWEDRGYYTGLVVTSKHDVEEQVFWVDVAPSEVDVDMNTGGFPCGYTRIRGKVIGGKIAEQGQSPWTALLWDREKEKPFCGGVLLNRRWVVTAAHCFGRESRFNSTHTDAVEIRLGEYDTHVTDGRELILGVDKIIIYPQYDEVTYDSDIALIKLRQPIAYTDHIVPLCLPSDMRAQQLVEADKKGFVTGWGNTAQDGQYSRYLRRVRLTIVDQQDCGNAHTDLVTSNMFCAAANPAASDRNKDACNGDSGGPFAIRDSMRWYLVGLVSWGIGCANPRFPGVYTRVHRFKQWIEDLIKDDTESCEESQFDFEEDLIEKKKEVTKLEGDVAKLEKQLQDKETELQTAISQSCEETTTVAPTTTEPPHIQTLPPAPTPVRIPCRSGSCWHVGGYRVYASCENDFCVCDSPDYNRESCLASVGRCEIHLSAGVTGAAPEAAHASYLGMRQDLYKCVTREPNRHSIHVLSVYEGNSHTRPPSAGDMDVVLETDSPSNKPVVLVLVSYEPVRWIIDVPDIVIIDEILLISYYIGESSIHWSGTPRDNVPVTESNSIPRGYGSDSGGGNTAGLLKYVRDNYGPVNSFTGTYRADSWTLDISYGNTPYIHRLPGTGIGGGGAVIPPVETLPGGVSSTAWTRRSFIYDNNWNDCNGMQYVRSTGLEVGAYVGVVLCSPSKYKIFLNDDLHSTFRNVADASGHGQDHCELVGAERSDQFNIDTDFWTSPSATGYYRPHWGDDFQIGDIGGGIGDGWTGKFYVKWYECGVSIP